MKHINARTEILKSNEIAEFLTDHLPYRIKILNNIISYPNKVNTDPLWPSIYESAQITCRMFIQFFGLRVNGNHNPELKPAQDYYSKDGIKSYEVKIKDLGFDFVQLNDLTKSEQEILAHAYESGNRATAHLTYRTSFDPDPGKVIQAAKLIRKIIQDKLSI